MCIIIHRTPRATLTRDIYEKCFQNNEDGMGFVLKDPEANQLIVKKGLFDLDDFLDAIEPYHGQEMLIHFRAASPGMAINPDQCHPFDFTSKDPWVKEDGKPLFEFAVCHNGKLSYVNTKERSDTDCFTREVLSPWAARDPWFLDNPPGLSYSPTEFVLREMIGVGNKLAFMRLNAETGELKTYILNKKKGETAYGCWFSNDYYRLNRVSHKHYGEYYGGYQGDSEYRKEQEEIDRIEKQIRMERPLNYISPWAIDDEGFEWDHVSQDWVNKTTGVHMKNRLGRYMPERVEAKKRYEVIKAQQEEEAEERIARADVNAKAELNHLDRSEKKRLFRLAVQWCKDEFPDKMLKEMDGVSKLHILRSDVKAYIANVATAGVIEVDEWILKQSTPLSELRKARGGENEESPPLGPETFSSLQEEAQSKLDEWTARQAAYKEEY